MAENLNRRHFLKASVAAGATAAFGGEPSEAKSSNEAFEHFHDLESTSMKFVQGLQKVFAQQGDTSYKDISREWLDKMRLSILPEFLDAYIQEMSAGTQVPRHVVGKEAFESAWRDAVDVGADPRVREFIRRELSFVTRMVLQGTSSNAPASRDRLYLGPRDRA